MKTLTPTEELIKQIGVYKHSNFKYIQESACIMNMSMVFEQNKILKLLLERFFSDTNPFTYKVLESEIDYLCKIYLSISYSDSECIKAYCLIYMNKKNHSNNG